MTAGFLGCAWSREMRRSSGPVKDIFNLFTSSYYACHYWYPSNCSFNERNIYFLCHLSLALSSLSVFSCSFSSGCTSLCTLVFLILSLHYIITSDYKDCWFNLLQALGGLKKNKKTSLQIIFYAMPCYNYCSQRHSKYEITKKKGHNLLPNISVYKIANAFVVKK